MFCRNGIEITLQDSSYFAPGCYPTMHLFRKGRPWTPWVEGDTPYPEISAVRCVTPLENFCIPKEARVEMAKTKKGEISVRVFAKEMAAHPILEWVFPSPEKSFEEMYKEFARGL